jgi:hypothetical protein
MELASRLQRLGRLYTERYRLTSPDRHEMAALTFSTLLFQVPYSFHRVGPRLP